MDIQILGGIALHIPPKIALFVGSLHGGGAEKMMVNLATGFVDRGYDVDMLLIKAEGPYLSLVPDQVRIVDLGVSRMRYCLPSLIRYLRKERPEAMVSSMGGANIFAIIARMITRVPMRLLVRVETTESRSIHYDRSLEKDVIHKLAALIFDFADGIIAVSHGVALDLMSCYKISKDKVHTVYNPIVDDTLFFRSQEVIDHPFFDSNNQIPLILAVGRLIKSKDYPTLIRAFADLRKQVPARLLILGEGDERDSIKELIQTLNLDSDITLAGFVKNPFAYMNKASLFVLSSLYEGLPTVLIEAMACGIQVVSTDCPSGPSEILEKGKWGKLVPVGDSSALAKAMAECLVSKVKPDVRKRSKDFSVDKAVDEHLRLLFPQ